MFRKYGMISGIPGIELQHDQSSGFTRDHGRHLSPDEETLTRQDRTVKLEVFGMVYLRKQKFPWEIFGLQIFRNASAYLPRQGYGQHWRRDDAFRCFVMKVAGIIIADGSSIIHGLPRRDRNFKSAERGACKF
jgi:hypothetical protein